MRSEVCSTLQLLFRCAKAVAAAIREEPWAREAQKRKSEKQDARRKEQTKRLKAAADGGDEASMARKWGGWHEIFDFWASTVMHF